MTTTHPGADVLRPRDDGLVELPWPASVLTPDGAVHRVAVSSRQHDADGGFRLRGAAEGLTVELTVSAARGEPARRCATLEVTARHDCTAGLRFEVLLGATDEPGWLVPGAFYGENRVPGCRRRYPRFEAGSYDPECMVSHTWHLRADRCATPAVFARDGVGGAALVTGERSDLGLTGVGLSVVDGRPALRLHFPYREEPISYYGSANPRPAEAAMHHFTAGRTYRCTFDIYLLDADPHAYAPVLRAVHAATPAVPAAWVTLDEGAQLAAWGLYRWHYRADPPVLLETAAFDREALGSRGDRPAMHVSWISGVPYAYALLRHARRVSNPDYRAAALGVLDHVAANLTPAGTFWGQWTESNGWNAGWTGECDRLHARTLADATLFLVRALAEERAAGIEHPGWEHAIRGNLAVARAAQDSDGHLGSAYHVTDGRVLSRAGAAGLSWVAALVEASALLGEPSLLDAARAAGLAYARDVRSEFICGAPEDVDLAPTSEDGYAAVLAYTALAEADGDDPLWTELAVRSAEWMLTFRYTYDVAFPERTMLARYEFRTRGADQASPSNQHLHSFGLVCLPEMARLARLTGDDYLLAVTRENLDCLRQFIAREDGDFGAYRGMVTERFYQTDCFQAKGMLLTLSHSWCVGLLLYACETAREIPELCEETE